MTGRILVVDDEPNIRTAIAKLLAKQGHQLEMAGGANEAMERMDSGRWHLVLTDLRMPGADGLSLLRRIKAIDSSVEVIVMTAYGTVDTAVEAMRAGAYDYIEKPVDTERLRLLIEKALEKHSLAKENLRLREVVKVKEEFGDLVGKSTVMSAVYRSIDMVAPTPATVLIQGESGVGKELIARAIHQRSTRTGGPLVSLNCGAIPESLLESELFGFEKGAFTGADSAHAGKIELSDKGTLFLDEVAEMSPKTQIELLRVLETRDLRRLGGSRLIKVDIRVIAATNRTLSEAIAEGRFREDLYYRLNVVPITVPPLRERREDIPLLASTFLDGFAVLYRRPRKRLSREAIESLIALNWPGNVRELKNLMERLTVMVNDSVIRPEDLPPEYRPREDATPRVEIPLGRTLEEMEAIVIRKTLAEITSHREKAAHILGISPRALHYKLKRHHIEPDK